MKRIRQFATLGVILSMVACNTVDKVGPSADLSVTTLNETLDFSDGQVFYHHIDLNHDGTVDFTLIGYRGPLAEQNEFGNMTFIRMVATTPENNTIGMDSESIRVCSMDIHYHPAYCLPNNYTIDPQASNWIRDPMLYVHMVTAAECSHYVKHYQDDRINTIGVRFMNEGHLFYGYIKLISEDNSPSGCPESSEKWTVTEYGYNKNVGQGFMIAG